MLVLSVLYQDDDVIAINKPSGLLVHRSPIDYHETIFALQILRDQVGKKVYPLHRLDRPTSGVLLFAFNRETARQISVCWSQSRKQYLAITRGLLHDSKIDNDITTDGKVKAAVTYVQRLAFSTIPFGFGRQGKAFPQTTFSLVKAIPQSGRKHQIRKHLKHQNHPIVGDTRYGKGDINRYFRQKLACQRLMLHASVLQFFHPRKQQFQTIYAPLDTTWLRFISSMSWQSESERDTRIIDEVMNG